MSATTLQSALSANLARLAIHNAELAELLRDAQPSSSIEFADTPQGVPAATMDGRQLCSRARPLDEASRLAESVDLIEHAVVVVLGFGLGYHVRALAERLGKRGIIIVFEPNVALLRTVFEQIDHSSWLGESRVLFITDAADRAGLATKLHDCEAVVAQGVTFLEHPASRGRLDEQSVKFTKLLTEHMTAAQVTMVTTLTRTVDTVRNLLLNIDHYAGGEGIAGLKNAAEGYPAILVAAGPSLQRNMHLLAQPGVRDRCVIIAVQTVLKPLLAAGIRPHFVTALDFHELSARFYEGLTQEDVRGVTLIADPKVHPSVLDMYPGERRCIGSEFLDRMMGEHARDMGKLPPGSTVAHLSLYLAKHLGCNPIAMIGQDLGFPDGLYYASGNAVHDVWAPELNPFNTIEMMEWQRIRRFRQHLHNTVDVHGKSIYTDAQMVTYLRQFERDFAQCKRDGFAVIDATEGGVPKQHARITPLCDVIEEYGKSELPALFREVAVEAQRATREDVRRCDAVRKRIGVIRRDIAALRETSKKTASLLRRMLDDQRDAAKMEKHFRKLDRLKKEVEQRMPAFEMLSQINQTGMFRRLKTDRKLAMASDLSPLARQRAEIKRDLDNVMWYAEAAEEMIDQLLAAERVLGDGTSDVERAPGRSRRSTLVARASSIAVGPSIKTRIAALVPVDPERNGLGIRRRLSDDFFGETVLQATLERLGKCTLLDEIILIVPHNFDIDALINREAINVPIVIERSDGSPFGPEHESIAAARLWAPTCWRGGIAGMSVYDEILCPQIMHAVLERRSITAALLAAPDWPLIDPSLRSGCDAVIARHLEDPASRTIVFTQAPPGLCGCVISTAFMADLANRNRLATIGARLVYQPHFPQPDPITTSANVQIDHRVRNSLIRATFDTPTYVELVRSALTGVSDIDDLSTVQIVEAIERCSGSGGGPMPRHIILEITSARSNYGVFAQPYSHVTRESMPLDLAQRIVEQFGQSSDAVLTLGGTGDPLLHPQCDVLIRSAKEAGIRSVHVRTELRASQDQMDRLLASGVDVISVDLHADRASTYEKMIGEDDFKQVLMNIEYCVENRRRLTSNSAAAALPMPWIVPRIQRRAETYEDLESFFDRWQHVLGAAVIEGAPGFPPSEEFPADTLTKPRPPQRVIDRDLDSRMMILSDGSVPVSELDLRGDTSVGNARKHDLQTLWSQLTAQRRRLRYMPSTPAMLRP